MLLNEFLKEHRKNEEQGRDIQEQKAIIALQQKQIDALTLGLQKVSAQLEASKRVHRKWSTIRKSRLDFRLRLQRLIPAGERIGLRSYR